MGFHSTNMPLTLRQRESADSAMRGGSEALKNSMEFSSYVRRLFQTHWRFETVIQTACKPGSVHTRKRALDGHSSGTGVATRLKQPTRAASRKPLRAHGFPRRRPPLFGFAPGGVFPAFAVTGEAVRSYRTLSPLPRQAVAVCFLWHFPWGRPRRPLAGTVFPWSPDFPLAINRQRPSNRLDRRGA